ncbi:MAG TPA: DsbC family protein [Dokdonella sp.]|uniref:DsbC family protein n=1 Tax=Dokdonella sp. TaxID=2291710 RepID=UPI002D7E263F|nr:DsbC family protein [Dokdonella sp.]HET9031941.1 DsbC family protein [Dokdonella sp.]
MMVLRALCLLALSFILVPAFADEGDAAHAAIQKIAPLQQVTAFRQSKLPGYYEGVIGGQLVYASADGRYLLRGTVEDTREGVNLSEASMAAKRRQLLATIGPEMRLSFAPENPKYRLTVFTDVDCPYCRRLHSRIDEFNALGIAFDYVFFPLSIHPGADRKSVSVWCSDDRKRAYTMAVKGQAPIAADCPNPLLQMRRAGNDIGVSMTPTAIAVDGSMIDSKVLLSPHRLLAELQKISAASDPSALAAAAAGR